MSDTNTTPDAAHADEQSRAERAAALAQELSAEALFGVSRVEEVADAGGEPETDVEPETDAEPEDEEQHEDPVGGDVQEPAEEDAAVQEAAQPSGDETEGEPEEESAGEAEEEPSAQAPALPSFGLLFQAPDLSDLPRRRSRRATAAVTTPPELPVEPEPAPLDGAETDGAPDTAETGEDEAGQRNGRRRRRGGKGRRGRGQGEVESSEQPLEADDTPQPEGGEQDGDDSEEGAPSASTRRRTRSRRARPEDGAAPADDTNGDEQSSGDEETSSTRRRRRRRRSGESGGAERSARDEVTSVKGSTRLEAKRQRRREGREAGRRRTIISEAEFLARRESVDRVMVVRGLEDRTQIAVLEDGVPVEHYVSRSAQSTMVGNVYLGRVQNVLPSMEAAFVDIGKGRNAVLYAGEVNWDAAGLGSEPKRIENALKSGESVLVQVTKDPIGHKGARLTSQISLPGRFLVYVPGNSMTGISRKLPDTERARLKKILKEVVPDDAGVIVRTAAEGASEAELRADVERLTAAWERISKAAQAKSTSAPTLLHGEPDMTVRVIRDVFTEDFSRLVVAGEQAWSEVKRYIDDVAPDLAPRVEKYTGTTDIFSTYRVHEAIAKAMDRKVWLPSGGSLIIDRTEAMTVVDVNTGKFTGSGGNLEETVTKNNIEAAEEIVRQLRLRDIGGIIVIDFIDMVLESNRDLVVRRLLECLGRDRTKHQVAEVTSLGLVQMTRKRVGSGLIEVFSETCTHCAGRGIVVQAEPVAARNGNGNGNGHQHQADNGSGSESGSGSSKRGRRGRGSGAGAGSAESAAEPKNVLNPPRPNGPTPAQIAAAAHAAALNAGAAPEAEADSPAIPVEESPEVPTQAPAPETAADVTSEAPLPVADTDESAPPVARTETVDDSVDAPVAEGVVVEVAEVEEAAVAEAAVVDAAPVTEEKPKRRRRGRASAPAGPPTAAESSAQE
ncbi:Rne/Rng family ribonuclease [Ornithinimicrobium tianjinense]|uniref:Ribonuclease E n=1 Tax=Ornithinimicrobium tianjinense TaxID=1195761 RepID=A0A917F6X0_9MICO|nr:Rne/Rng family ribonuclease [Ornithinimicrobium tianjinense]GGF49711.1 hypothetical protein GCM10011366_17000 [Ornithinimicrobium tianjinense]